MIRTRYPHSLCHILVRHPPHKAVHVPGSIMLYPNMPIMQKTFKIHGDLKLCTVHRVDDIDISQGLISVTRKPPNVTKKLLWRCIKLSA